MKEWIYEDELPELTDEQYSKAFENSIVNGVRLFKNLCYKCGTYNAGNCIIDPWQGAVYCNQHTPLKQS
jgi:hypothetical protein